MCKTNLKIAEFLNNEEVRKLSQESGCREQFTSWKKRENILHQCKILSQSNRRNPKYIYLVFNTILFSDIYFLYKYFVLRGHKYRSATSGKYEQYEKN